MQQVDLYDLMKNNTISLNEYHFLFNEITNNKSFIIVGSAGTGKTTLMNSMLEFIDRNKKISIISDELSVINLANNSKISPRKNSKEEIVSFIKKNEDFNRKLIMVDDFYQFDFIDFKNFQQRLFSLHGKTPKQAIDNYLNNYKENIDRVKISSKRDFLDLFDYIIVLSDDYRNRGINIYSINSLDNENSMYLKLDV